MNKIEAQIKRYGLSQDELPTPVISKIEELESLQNDIKGATADLEAEEDDEARKEMRSKILEGKEFAEELQSEIILHIQTFARKKHESQSKEKEAQTRRDVQRERETQRLREVQRAKARANVVGRQRPQTTPTSETVNTSSTTPAAVTDNAVKPKKSNKTLAWIIGGAVLVLTLGAVNTLTKK